MTIGFLVFVQLSGELSLGKGKWGTSGETTQESRTCTLQQKPEKLDTVVIFLYFGLIINKIHNNIYKNMMLVGKYLKSRVFRISG